MSTDRPARRAPRTGAPAAPRVRRPATPLVELALGAAWLVGIAAVLQLVAVVAARSPLAAALAGAVVADIAGARAGVRWDDDLAEAQNRTLLARRIGIGASFGALGALLTLLLALAFGWVHVELGHPSPSLALALIRSSALSVRDEILLTGIGVAAAARAGVPARFAVPFAALAHGAVVAFAPGSSAAALALAVASGALFASLWHRYRGAWAAMAASAVWGMLAGAGLRGGLLDATWTGGALALGARASGRSAWIAAIVFLAIAVLAGPVGRALTRRRRGPSRPAAPSPPPSPPEASNEASDGPTADAS